MNATNLHSEPISITHTQRWYEVRTALVITLAVLLGVFGLVTICPSVVDHTLAAGL